MILRTETVEQIIDGTQKGHFIKDVIMTSSGKEPLGMVRKKRKDLEGETRPVVLLIHGFGQNRYSWHNSRRSFANHLAQSGYDVFNADLRGHGRSRRFGAAPPRSLDDYIQEDIPSILSEIEKITGQSQLYVVGHSMGGLIAYCAASTLARNEIKGVVSIGTPFHFAEGSPFLFFIKMFGQVATLSGMARKHWHLPVRAIGDHLNKRSYIWDKELMPLPIRGWVPGGVEKEILSEYINRSFEQTTLGVALELFRSGAQDGLRSMDGTYDYRTAFSLMQKPLLIVAGTQDKIAPAESVKPAYDVSQSNDKMYRAFPFGHVDLVMGKEATGTVWPLIHDWLHSKTASTSMGLMERPSDQPM